MENKEKSGLSMFGNVLLWIGAIYSLGMGIYKLYFYENYEGLVSSSSRQVNAYVGGDAYNYIINGTHATAYFVLFGVFVISLFLNRILSVVKSSENN